jgi:ATP-dependent Clp protease ATP-binding subunit ClpA
MNPPPKQPVLVEEPSEAECLALLRGLAPRYEAHHRVHYAPAALAAAVTSAKR